MNLKLVFQIASNTIVQSLGKVVSVGLSFISIALLTRYLGIAGYGNFTLVFSYLAFFSLIADFGLQVVAVKEIAGAKEKIERLYGTYLLLRFCLVLVSSFLALIFLLFFPYSSELKMAIIIGTIAVGVSGMTGYFNTLFQAKIRLDLLTLVDLLGKFGSVLTIVLSVYFKLNFYFIVGSVLFGNIVSFIIGLLLLPHTITTAFDYTFAKRLLLLSIPVGITSLLSTLYFKIDTIILSLLKPSTDVGIYSLAYKILENITLFWFFYVGTVFPLLAKLKAENRTKYKKLFNNSILLAIVISLPIIIISYILSPIVIMFFGGQQFNNSVSALRILLFSLPFLLVNTLFYNFYILEEFNIVVILGMFISLVFNVICNIIFIPHYSYVAASYITVFSEIILLTSYLLGLIFFKKENKLI